MRIPTFLLTAVMLSVAFAGCSGNDGPATADFSATALNADKSTYRFDAGNSSGSGLVYTWDFGDQSPPGTGEVVEHTYQYPNGKYTVTLTVKDADGVESEKKDKVQVGEGQNTVPVLYLSADTRWIAPGGSVTFDATQSFDADGDPIIFKWDFNDLRDPADFNDMENLGSHQYGIYRYGAPAGGASGGSSNDTGNGTGLLLTPSGHVWADEYAKAQKRVLDAAGVKTFDGDHSIKPEPRNEAYDGKTDDTSPIQIWTFPDPATYFVYVQVVDVKGDYADGFIRINVDPNVPETTYSNQTSGTLQPEVFGNLADTNEELNNYDFHTFEAAYPAVFDITITHNPSGGGPVPTDVGGYVCGATISSPVDCSQKPTKLDPWPSGETYTFQVTPGIVGAYRLLVRAEGQSGPVEYDLDIQGTIYPNKWYLEEAGLAQGH